MTSTRDSDHAFTKYGWLVCAWILLGPFQYGWHISVLNQIQATLTCVDADHAAASYLGLPLCLPMNDTAFSAVTSILSFGGLVGSLLSDAAMEQWGRRGATRASALMFAIGSTMMALAPSFEFMMFGRFLVGVGAGGLSIAPIYIAEISPKKLKGLVGVLNQLSIVLGLMLTQITGLQLATPTTWRYVLVISSILGIVQFFLSASVVESPAWLRAQHRESEAEAALKKVWNMPAPAAQTSEDDIEDPLLDTPEDPPARPRETVPLSQLIRARELRRPLLAVGFMMLSQQVSGINAVLYYSNAILSKSLPDLGPYVSVGITVVNVVMTIPPIFLIERLGRKRLLYGSSIAVIVSLLGVGAGLNSGSVPLASVAIIAFVASFAMGLGPVPFVLIPELAPFHAVSALSSFGISLHWIANFTVGQVFLPLRNLLSGGDAAKEGYVFFVFSAALASSMFAFSQLYR